MIENQDPTPMLLAETLKPLIAKSRQPIFVSDNECLNVPWIHRIHQSQKPRASKAHATPDFRNQLDPCEAPRRTELL